MHPSICCDERKSVYSTASQDSNSTVDLYFPYTKIELLISIPKILTNEIRDGLTNKTVMIYCKY